MGFMHDENSMKNFDLNLQEINYDFPMIFVQGTNGTPYLFGLENSKLEINVNDFFISKYPVTQVLWEYIMSGNPSYFKQEDRPVETVSYDEITNQNGFLNRLNTSNKVKIQPPISGKFRLPTETEWEYAARGGLYWKDNFIYSGSTNISEVAWQGDKHSGTETHPVGQKKPNQLGIHDMCGNVWEWCQDYFQGDITQIPKDGTPCLIESTERVLRGGCHHNWEIHCTVSKRYEITPDAKDECIGFRIAFSPNKATP
jgi:formylglycine-generating enzyme